MLLLSGKAELSLGGPVESPLLSALYRTLHVDFKITGIISLPEPLFCLNIQPKDGDKSLRMCLSQPSLDHVSVLPSESTLTKTVIHCSEPALLSFLTGEARHAIEE